MRRLFVTVSVVWCFATVDGCSAYTAGAFMHQPQPPNKGFARDSSNNNIEGASNEADLIYAINACRTLDNVNRLVVGASVSFPAASVFEDEEAGWDTIDPPALAVGPNVAAAALRKTVQFSNGQDAPTNSHLPLLLQNIGTAVILSLQKETSNGIDIEESLAITPYALADTLVSLSRLSKSSPKFRPLTRRVCDLMETQPETFIRVVRPKRLMQCIEAMSWLSIAKPRFVNAACQRLSKGDALSLLSAKDLSFVIELCSHLDPEDAVQAGYMQTFTRRIRKQQIRQKASSIDLGRAIVAAEQLACNSPDVKSETETMCYTLSKELLGRGAPLRPAFVGKILLSCYNFGMKSNEELFGDLKISLLHRAKLTKASAKDISQLLMSMERIKLTDSPDVALAIGKRFLKIVEHEVSSLDAAVVNRIFRSVAILYRQDRTVMQPYLQAAKKLLQETTSDKGNTKSFLDECDALDLSNFIWFMAFTKWYDEDLLSRVAHRILTPEISDSCSPKLASKILGTFTTLSSRKSHSRVEGLQYELFHVLGTQLLSTKLTPIDASAALFAYAKASYIQDMGIFDHLSEWIASNVERKDFTTRQLSQSLWSCGKMAMFEDETLGKDNEKSVQEPPYLASARKLATVLSQRTKELTPNDVAQSIWACGRLGINDFNIVYALAYRSKAVASKCSTQELANIIWGLSRVGFQDEQIINDLTKPILDPRKSPNAQECSNVLYALGRMHIRDEEAFSVLTGKMMDQLEDATQQAIANVLWAHKTVQLSTPQQLLDSWAIKKLGLDGIVIPADNPTE